MTDRCSHCPYPVGLDCPAVAALCSRLIDPALALAFTTRNLGPAAPETARMPLAEVVKLTRRMKECEDREETTDCGCGGLAKCRRGKGTGGLVNHFDCFDCLGGMNTDG